jgi:uncharacterized protein YhaN
MAYGPFTNVELDLGAPGIQMVYGKNEAGKSTALRAITGLFYGIAKNTPDAHVHKMPDLRVGGSVRSASGGTLHLVRRKGKDNTLLDRDGRAVDEAVLARLLGGVSQDQFLTMFGLDHETLRRGGEALLLGQGNIGENLFGAAMAGGELHQVLRALRQEAEALFTAKAHTRPLNEAIKAWALAHKRTRDESMSHESIATQTRELDELRRERATCEADRQLLTIERSKLERARRALPILAKHKGLLERREAMGSVVLLAPGSKASRIAEQRTASEADLEIARFEARLFDLNQRKSKLVVPESLVLHKEVPLDLANRLGSHLKALRDLPRVQGEIDELETEARAILRRMGRDVPLDRAEGWRVDAASQATIRKLTRDATALLEAKAQTQRALVERTARLAALSAKRATLPPTPDTSALKKAVSRAERDGALDERLAKAITQASRIEQSAEAQLSSLGSGAVSLVNAPGLPIPSGETIERFARLWVAHEKNEERLAKRALDVASRSASLTRDIEALELAGKVPTERDLLAARKQRDERWHLVRESLPRTTIKKGRGGRSTEESALVKYENEVRAADDIADRLRREAERVTRLAALLADREACKEERADVAAQQTELAERRASDRQAWRALWQSVGIEPQPPLEMKDWLLRHAALVRAIEELRQAEAEIASIRATIEAHRAPIGALLEALGAPAPASSSLASLLDQAGNRLDAVGRAEVLRHQIDRDIGELESQIVEQRAAAREHEAAGENLEKAWQTALAPLGLTAKASPEQATVTIDLLGDAFHKIDQAEAARRRAAGIERDAQTFGDDVRKLASEHAPDLLGRPPEEAATQIIERHRQGQVTLAERRELDRHLQETSQLLEEQKTRRRSAEARIAELLAEARVDSTEELERAERRSDEARTLEQEIAQLESQLLDIGADAVALRAEIETSGADELAARLEDVEREIEELREQQRVIDQRIGGCESGLKALGDPKARAAEAAADAEEELAKVREITERYLRVRVASIVLAREIERYRQENQGPILTRAGELFRRLTLGSFTSLRADFDEKDQPVLRGVRSDDRDVGVEAMSDGTRDQLYLALRLATLERYAEHNDPMPLVVDDILIHFDDDRARAALEVLGELSLNTQVLFFTHHARLVELAERVIPKTRLFVRELSESAPRANPAVV